MEESLRFLEVDPGGIYLFSFIPPLEIIVPRQHLWMITGFDAPKAGQGAILPRSLQKGISAIKDYCQLQLIEMKLETQIPL